MDDIVIACWPVARAGRVVADSVIGSCSVCDAAIWVAPSSIDLMARNNVRTICMPCAEEVFPADEVVHVTQGQLDEIARDDPQAAARLAEQNLTVGKVQRRLREL
jgi:hypothetical protein